MRWMLPLILLLGCPSTATEPVVEDPEPLPWTAPEEPGPYGVGARTLQWFDARDKLLTAELWYPADVEPGSEGDDYGLVSRTGIAHRDADGDLRGAPHPLIAFSHGFGGVRYQSTFLTEHLASHGFVVVAVDHPTNTLFDLDEDNAAQVASERPMDVSASVDRIHELAEGGWFGLRDLVDPEAGYGMLGHSFGGWTSMAVAGGRVDPAFAETWCAEHDDAACGFLGDLSVVDDISQAAPDPRVVATVALAPGAWYTFGEDGLDDIATPLILGGDLDGDMPYDGEIVPLYEHIGAPDKALLTLHRAAHWGFTDLCGTLPVDAFDDCQGEEGGYIDPSVSAAITNEATTAWFGLHLAGDDRGMASIGPERWNVEGVTSWRSP
jgi:predicted dienelactone hydrolase